MGTGRRKKAIARIILRQGSGNIRINGRPMDEYFPLESAKVRLRQPLLATETAD